jgi:hypothetical protein
MVPHLILESIRYGMASGLLNLRTEGKGYLVEGVATVSSQAVVNDNANGRTKKSGYVR